MGKNLEQITGLNFLVRLCISTGGNCGFYGHVFIVYDLYLFVISAVLKPAVTDHQGTIIWSHAKTRYLPPHNQCQWLTFRARGGRYMLQKNTQTYKLTKSHATLLEDSFIHFTVGQLFFASPQSF